MIWIYLGLISAAFLSLIAGGSWGICKIAWDFGAIQALIFICGSGSIISVTIMAWGSFPLSNNKIKHPILSSLFVFVILFLAICLAEGLLYDAYSLITS